MANRSLPPKYGRPPLPLLLQLHGSVIDRVTKPVALFSLYAGFIYLLDLFSVAPNLGAGGSSLAGILSMILGLMVSYRSGTSSDRWHEGRRLWCSLTATSRTMLRTLSLSLPELGGQHDQAVREMLALVVALPHALKFHLRDQDPLSSAHFRSFLPQSFLQQLQLTSPALARSTTSQLEGPDDNEASRSLKAMNDDTPKELKIRSQPIATRSGATRNMPQLVIRQMHAYLNAFHNHPSGSGSNEMALDSANWGNCVQMLKEVTDLCSQMERIRDTPIPVVLSIHLQQMLFLYLCALPPSFVRTLGIWTIPATAIAAFTFYGVDRAAEQLSDPFGIEPNDLPLDRFAADIEGEFKEYIDDRTPIASFEPHPLHVDEKIKKEL